MNLTKAREELTERYRSGKGAFITTDEHRLAYIASRMPATKGANLHVFQKIPGKIESLLDLGAGPGTSMWAAAEIFPDLKQILLLEKDSSLIEMGKKLTFDSSHPAIQSAKWICTDLERMKEFPPHDLVVLSYSAGECNYASFLKHAWSAAQKYLVIIEPGTPIGFERIRSFRESLLALGAHIVAPCPHAKGCPASWCHFSERIERTSLHRRIKGGELSYEDEKFAYTVVSKTAHSLPDARVVRHPQKRPGHILLSLCTSEGNLKEETISKKEGEAYKRARKVKWGDEIL